MFSSASRWLLLVAAAATLVLGASACGDSDDDAAPPPAAQTADDRVEPEDSGTGDAASQGDRTDESADAEPDVEPSEPATPDGGGEAPGDGASDSQAADERAAVAVATRMYADLAAADARGVCAVMSKAVRREIAQNVHGGSTVPPEERTCATSFAVFLDAAATSGLLEQTLKAQVGEATVKGGSARVTVTIDGKSGEVELVKEDGQWRFGAAPTGPKS